MLNILFTLMLGLFAISLFDKLGKKYYISLPLVFVMLYLGKILCVDYGWYGVAAVFILYLCRNRKVLRMVAFAMLNFTYYYPRLIANYTNSSLISYLFATLPVILLLFYNGKLGRKTKYGYYIFYPLHMVILYVVNILWT